jgi:RNA polymerase sigma factor FliA
VESTVRRRSGSGHGEHPRDGGREEPLDQPSRQMVTDHLHLVHRVVAQLARKLPANVLRDDLLSAGVFGLVVALRRNGGADGATFQWYARTRIRGAVFDELRAQDWLSRRARDRATSEKAKTGCSTAFVSLDEVTGEGGVRELAAGDDPALEAETRCQKRALSRALSRLPERERRIVALHYFDGVKLKDIGTELGVSEPRVSQLHARALLQLRSLLADDVAA